MQLMASNLYETTLSDLIAKGDTHLEIRCTCERTVCMPLRLLSLPCGASLKELRDRLACRRCTRRPFSIEGYNAADHVPHPGRPWPPSGYQRPPAAPEVATADSPIVRETEKMPCTPISAGLGPGGVNLLEFAGDIATGGARPDM